MINLLSTGVANSVDSFVFEKESWQPSVSSNDRTNHLTWLLGQRYMTEKFQEFVFWCQWIPITGPISNLYLFGIKVKQKIFDSENQSIIKLYAIISSWSIHKFLCSYPILKRQFNRKVLFLKRSLRWCEIRRSVITNFFSKWNVRKTNKINCFLKSC